jgi:DNA-binding NtrC family response regulator
VASEFKPRPRAGHASRDEGNESTLIALPLMGLYLEDLGYQFDLVTNTDVDEEYLASKSYDCVLVNIDQNSDSWRDAGLSLAEKASRLSVPVVMIADHAFAAQAATAKGWEPIQKPFTLERLQSAISQAVGVP